MSNTTDETKAGRGIRRFFASLVRNWTYNELEVLAAVAQLAVAKAKETRGDAFSDTETLEDIFTAEEFAEIVATARECVLKQTA